MDQCFVQVSAFVLLTLAGGSSKAADTAAVRIGNAPVQYTTERKQTQLLKLGDLSAFHSIALDIASIVNKGDLPVAKTKIRGLEVAWDSAEAGLKPQAAADWPASNK